MPASCAHVVRRGPRDARCRERAGPMSSAQKHGKRWPLIVIALIGLGLIAAPAIFQMFDRAPKGAAMIADFEPYMNDSRLNGFQREVRQIDEGVREADTSVARALTGSGPAAHRRFDTRFPGFAAFQAQWGTIHADMKNLMDTIQANVGNYEAMAGLPNFKLFPWFFVIPGVLVVLVALAGLVLPRGRRQARWTIAAIGIGLLLAPLVFGMFSAGPKGGRMMTAFETLETREKVETIQGYFGTIAIGQGTLRLELVPALRKTGLSDREIAAKYPALTTLNERWISILNDLTPMIGTMSDNVDNYEAVAALPPFPLFPWFFVAPGLLLAGLALGPGRRTSADSLRTPAHQGGLAA